MAHRSGYCRRDVHSRDNTPNHLAMAHFDQAVGHGEVAVIADGAGSASRSDEGSRLAVDTAVATVAQGINLHPAVASAERMAQSLVRGPYDEPNTRWNGMGQRNDVPTRELAGTLIVAFASEDLVTAAQGGDGAAIACDIGSGSAKTLCAAHTGEYANKTTFITSRSQPHEIAPVGHAPGHEYDSVALITDGLQNLALKMPEREAFLGFRNPMLNDQAQTDEPEAVSARLHSFITGERVQSRTTDDVTIIIAARHRRGGKKEPQ